MRNKSRESLKGNKTKTDILDAAVNLYIKGGYKAVTIAAICSMVRCTPTSVYWHFTNKAELLHSVLTALNISSNENFVSTLSGKAKPATRAKRFAKALKEFIVTHPAGAMTMLTLSREGEPADELKNLLRENRERELLEQSSKLMGLLGIKTRDATMLALRINSTANYAALIYFMGATEKEIDQLVNVVEQDILRQIAP